MAASLLAVLHELGKELVYMIGRIALYGLDLFTDRFEIHSLIGVLTSCGIRLTEGSECSGKSGVIQCGPNFLF